jgi:hypothetical protein
VHCVEEEKILSSSQKNLFDIQGIVDQYRQEIIERWVPYDEIRQFIQYSRKNRSYLPITILHVA